MKNQLFFLELKEGTGQLIIQTDRQIDRISATRNVASINECFISTYNEKSV